MKNKTPENHENRAVRAALIVGKGLLQTSPVLPEGRRAWRSGMAERGVDLGDLGREEGTSPERRQVL